MIIIVGAGLSGLLTAYLLKKEGIPFKILEARDRIGGRINTIYKTKKAPIDLGATWFTNQHLQLITLLKELGIEYFEQSLDNKVYYESSEISPVQLVQIPSQSPSYRISGGSLTLINSLIDKLDETDILLNQSVKHIKINTNSIQVNSDEAFECNSIVLAIPPKLWSKKIAFDPVLPTNLMNVATQTQTWMEDSIKVALTYDQPFWKKENLSGTLFSNIGPITEFYDHSNHNKSRYALCGFMNTDLNKSSYTDRRKVVIKQLINIFGQRAAEYNDYEECIWSNEENTFEYSENFLIPHQNNGNPIFNNSVFNGKVLISSTESASNFPGYMEGAVISANKTAIELIKENRLINPINFKS
ncbi:FAD-dependent oxidoreductase [Vicingaceae bacterium]|nr:FAD-dependent oxidoreductase [Vicingaceae bacterium]